MCAHGFCPSGFPHNLAAIHKPFAIPNQPTLEVMATISNLALDTGLPANVDAERTILGAILLDNAAHSEAAEKLTEDDFSLDSHRRIFLRMSELMNASRAVDIVTLSNELARMKEIESVGGVAYLASLTEGLPRRPVIEEYIRIVKDKSLLRKLMLICSSAIARAADQSEDAIGVLDVTESQLLEVSQKGLTTGLQPIDQIVAGSFGAIDNLYKQSREVTGLATDFIEFDRMTSGLQKGMIGREDQIKLQNALNQLVESRMFIDDSAGISLAEMRAKARRLKQNAGGLDLVVVDYLQLMTATLPSGGRKGYENRTQEVSAISRGLKALAKELQVPVVALSQLSRAGVQRKDDHRPMLSDLRESGSIEQDADLVAFIHREAYYMHNKDELSDAEKAKSEIIIAKQRNGPTDTVFLNFIGKFTRFENQDMGHEV